MTVKELKEKLNQFDDDAPVKIWDDSELEYFELESVGEIHSEKFHGEPMLYMIKD